MTFIDMLRDATAQNNSLLCVGLDPEPTRFPAGMQGDAHKIYDFCAAIVDATADLVCAFKPQIAYFAAHGAEDQLDITFDRRTIHVNPQVGHVVDEGQKPRFLLRAANWLHLNRGKKAWTYFADGYAAGLLFLALSGLFMLPGRKGIVGRGAIFVGLGVAIPVVYVVLAS